MISFRAAVAADAYAITKLVNSAYRGEGSKQGWTTEADLLGGQRTDPEKILEMIQGAGSRIELATQHGKTLVGCVYLKKEPKQTCYLGMLSVDPALQTWGIGKRLLERSEEIARQWRCVRMRMSVIHLREELLQYYQRRGYQKTGAWEAFPEHDPRFGLPKVQGLKFLELEKTLSNMEFSPVP